MSDDIVARLRSNARFFGLVKLGSRATIEPEFCAETAEWFNDAADEIERLRAELRSYTGDKHTTREPFEPTEPFTPEAL